jgi:hypothetical protein
MSSNARFCGTTALEMRSNLNLGSCPAVAAFSPRLLFCGVKSAHGVGMVGVNTLGSGTVLCHDVNKYVVVPYTFFVVSPDGTHGVLLLACGNRYHVALLLP